MIQKRHEWIVEELKVLKDKGLIDKPRVRGNKGYAEFPIKWSVEGNFKDYAIKENGILYKAFASFKLDENRRGIVFIDMDTRKIVHDTLLQKTIEDKNYITYRKEMTDKYAYELIKFCNKTLTRKNTCEASKQQLMEWYDTFRDIYTKYEFYNGIWFIISDDLAQMVVERMEKSGCSSPEDIQSLMTPTEQSFINRENIDMLSLASIIKKDKIVTDIISKGNDDSYDRFMKTKYASKLILLVKKYHWIPFGHVGPDLYGPKHYFDEIKKIMINEEDIFMKLREAKGFYPAIAQRQNEIIQKYNIDKDTVRLIKDIHILAQMQDERKEIIARTHINWMDNLMQQIGKYLGFNARQAADLYPDEIKKCLLQDIIDLGEYRKDEKSTRFFKITEPDGYTNYYDTDAEPFLSIIESEKINDELCGNPACRGKAIGRVKVLKNSDEIFKVERGDVLVTTMTTPDFVPAMRIAAAIITDEGGITCHAAIVSRELKIPCIVNTRNATQILKDNEIVEVDAFAGKIRKIE